MKLLQNSGIFDVTIKDDDIEYTEDSEVLNELLRRYDELKNSMDELEEIINQIIEQYE